MSPRIKYIAQIALSYILDLNYVLIYILLMKQNTKLSNSTELHIWIAENGDNQARLLICKEAQITAATLCRIIKGHMPRFEIRYRIYKATGIKLDGDDKFPELIPKATAS